MPPNELDHPVWVAVRKKFPNGYPTASAAISILTRAGYDYKGLHKPSMATHSTYLFTLESAEGMRMLTFTHAEMAEETLLYEP